VDEEHLANTCPRRNNSRTRNAKLIEDFQETLISVDEYMSDNESIYSVISIDAIDGRQQDSSDSEEETLVNEIGLDKIDLKIKDYTFVNILCDHQFCKGKGLDSQRCFNCTGYPSKDKRAKCVNCNIEGCIKCIDKIFNIKIINQTIGTKETLIPLEKRIDSLEDRVSKLEKGKEKVEEEINQNTTKVEIELLNE